MRRYPHRCGLRPARWPSVPPDLHFSVYHFTMAVLWAMRSDTAPRTGPRQEGEAGMRVYGILTLVMALLQRERRVSYWALKQEFGLDDAFIEGLKQELIVAKRVAIDEGGQVLVWSGGELPPVTPADTPASIPEPVRHAPEAERRQVTV